MNGRANRQAWERLGAIDPYFAVAGQAQYRREVLDDTALDTFFASGEAHVAALFDTIHAHLDPDFAPTRVLDFGCGVGRILIPLARRCASVVGIDHSTTMLAEARRHSEARGLTNVELVPSDNTLSALGREVDLIHAYLVFQHIPVRGGLALLAELLPSLAPGGVGAIQFIYRMEQSMARSLLRRLRYQLPHVHRLLNRIEGHATDYPLIQMHAYPLDTVLGLLHDHGCRQLFGQMQRNAGHHSLFIFFQRAQ